MMLKISSKSLSEIISHCSDYQDVTIICENGTLNVSSVLLALTFPIMRDLISSHNEMKLYISMPDFRLIKLAKFINSVCNQEEEIYIDSFINQLLKSKDENDDGIMKSTDTPMIKIDTIQTDELVPIKKESTEIEERPHNSINNKPFTSAGKPCTECDKILYSRMEWRNHRAKHLRKKAKLIPKGFSKCKMCKMNFAIKEVDDHECKLYPCQSCSKKFSSEEKVSKHYRLIHEGAFIQSCEICGKVCNSTSGLQYHKTAEHEINLMDCNICGKGFKTKTLLGFHKESHEEKVPCQKCSKKIRAKNLGYHMITSHLEDSQKPFQCDKCDKGFVTNETLERHNKNVHLKVKHYCRYGCTFAYSSNGNRAAHEHKVHGGLFNKEEFLS